MPIMSGGTGIFSVTNKPNLVMKSSTELHGHYEYMILTVLRTHSKKMFSRKFIPQGIHLQSPTIDC